MSWLLQRFRPEFSRCELVLLGALVAMGACWGCGPSVSEPKSPKLQDDQQTVSRIQADPLHPLLIEWPAAERARLESRAKEGLVAVRYHGAKLEVVPACHSDRGYEYVASTVHRDRVDIQSRDQLGAKLPLSVASLGAKLQQFGRLNVEVAIVGAFSVKPDDVSSVDFDGDCSRATHFVSGISAGAFEVNSGASVDASGGVSAAGVGVEGGRGRRREVLSRAGNLTACARATSQDEQPPYGCGALVRLELTPLKRSDAEPSTVAAAVPNAPPASPTETRPSRRSEPLAPASSPSPSPEPSEPPGGESIWALIIPGSLIVIGVTVGVVIAVTKKDDEPERDPAPQGGLGNTTLGWPVGISF